MRRQGGYGVDEGKAADIRPSLRPSISDIHRVLDQLLALLALRLFDLSAASAAQKLSHVLPSFNFRRRELPTGLQMKFSNCCSFSKLPCSILDHQ